MTDQGFDAAVVVDRVKPFMYTCGQFGVRYAPTLDCGSDGSLTVLSEDDGFWHEQSSFDIAHLRNLMVVLEVARELLGLPVPDLGEEDD